MADSGEKPRIHGAARDDGAASGPGVPQTRTTWNALANSSTLNMTLRGLVGLIALLCSLSMVTPRNRPVPLGEPRSDAVDHVNP